MFPAQHRELNDCVSFVNLISEEHAVQERTCKPSYSLLVFKVT